MILSEIKNINALPNLPPAKTGVSTKIYISSGKAVNFQHGPRIKFGDSREGILAFNDKGNTQFIKLPRHLAKHQKELLNFVNTNIQVLLDLWNDKIDNAQAMSQIRNVRSIVVQKQP